MNRIIKATTVTLVVLISVAALAQNSQSTLGAQLAELNSLKENIKSSDTRTRVDAFHRAWSIAVASDDTNVKLLALDLMKEPVGVHRTTSGCLRCMQLPRSPTAPRI
jgi:hypothetical protein